VLFQLGGPDSLEAVEPFLLNLFLDPDIIPLRAFWAVCAVRLRSLISSRRSIPVPGRYAKSGDARRLGMLTEAGSACGWSKPSLLTLIGCRCSDALLVLYAEAVDALRERRTAGLKSSSCRCIRIIQYATTLSS